ncbi:MAG: glycosyltransferase [Pseudomonadota bacterium]
MQLTKAMAQAGIDVDVIYGGVPLEGAAFEAGSVFHLPPIAVTDASYAHYIDGTGAPLSNPWMTARQALLLEHFATLQPDLLLFEAFPFGRRRVRSEIIALIEAAKKRTPKPIIVSSVRDILQENRKPGRAEETAEWVNTLFDHVLVHSDPALVKLGATFPMFDAIEERVRYSGFVVKDDPKPTVSPPRVDVIVSAGGGAFGQTLMRTAKKAALSDPQDRHWHIIHGQNADVETKANLTESVSDRITVSRNVDHLRAHMKTAGVTVSQCGYNTAMDALEARLDSSCGIVFVPHDLDNQTEQLRRSQLLEQNGYCVCLPESTCTAATLLAAIDRAALLEPITHEIDFSGAATSAHLLKNWALDAKDADPQQ